MPANSFFAELKRRNVLKVAIAYVILSWLLVQVADVVFPALNLPDWSVTLVVALLLLGFLPILIFAWVYELTPEGLERTEDVGHGESITPETGRKMDILIVVLSALVIGVVTLDRMIPERLPTPDLSETIQDIDPAKLAASWTEPPSKSSIAVLPFVNMSADPDQEYFSDGLAEELLNMLSRVPTLLVTSRTSAFSFKDKDVTIAEIAKALNVAYVLEGSVRKSGNRVRITAQLIDAERDVHLWSETWDRTLDDVFAIQDDIANRVVAKMTDNSAEKAPEAVRTNSDAYDLFLLANNLLRNINEKNVKKAIELYERAVDIDPAYVPAWTHLAGLYSNLARATGWHNIVGRRKALNKSREAIERAMAINPEYPEVYAVLGSLAREDSHDLNSSINYYKKGLELDPSNSTLLNNTAMVLMDVERMGDALKIYQDLVIRDPINITRLSNYADALYQAGDFERADALLDRALMLSPEAPFIIWFRAASYCLQNQYNACLESFSALADLVGDESHRLVGEAYAFPAMGRRKEGEEALEQLLKDTHLTYTAGVLLTRYGQYERALDYLEKLEFRRRRFVFVTPDFEVLHDNPRWQRLIEEWESEEERVKKKYADVEFDINVLQ